MSSQQLVLSSNNAEEGINSILEICQRFDRYRNNVFNGYLIVGKDP